MNIPPQKSEYEDESIEHGPELDNLKEFGNGMDSMTLGHVLTNSDLLRTTHNSFTSSSPFSISADPRSKEKEDAYHFIAYVPVGGALWELDGLREGAIRHGEVKEGEGEGWTGKAREVIQERIGTYPEGSLMFNLLAIRSAPLPRIKRLLKDPSTPDDLIPDLTAQLTQETDKEHRGQLENGLRRGNLVGMIMECLKAMGGAKGVTEGQTVLEEATERARAVGKERREKRLGGMDVD